MHFRQTLKALEHEACKTVKMLFETFSDKFKLQNNQKILSLQISKKVR